MLDRHDERSLTQRLMPIGITAIALGAIWIEAPRQWGKYQARQNEVSRVAELQRSNELLEQERKIANTRYEGDCLFLYENSVVAQIVPSAIAVSGTSGQPLQPGLVVCDGIGGTAIVGEGGKLTQFAGNAAPEIIQKAIERATGRSITVPVKSTTPSEG